jgi:hypothetical protein
LWVCGNSACHSSLRDILRRRRNDPYCAHVFIACDRISPECLRGFEIDDQFILGLGPRQSHQRLQQGFLSRETDSGVSLHGSSPEPLMSALGHKRTLGLVSLMTALPPKADIAQHGGNVRFVARSRLRAKHEVPEI